ncbi:MAG: hypothetical protein AB1560_08180 [Pseudomonadota bacterium]
MRKFIVTITLLYTAAAVAALGFISDWFREALAFGDSAIVMTLAISVPTALLLAILAWWKDNEWLAVLLAAVILGAGGYALKLHHDAYGEWLPTNVSADTETSGTAMLNAHGQTLRYRLELHNPGSVTHREYLVITRGDEQRRIRLPLFGDARSGYVSAKSPADWIVLRPTPDANVYAAETGPFLFVRKSFTVDLRAGKATAVSSLPVQ